MKTRSGKGPDSLCGHIFWSLCRRGKKASLSTYSKIQFKRCFYLSGLNRMAEEHWFRSFMRKNFEVPVHAA